MAAYVPRTQGAVLALSCALAVWCVNCNSGGDGSSGVPGSDPFQRPGGCICYDGGGNFRSCVVTADYQTCLDMVTTCNPFFYTNGDCSHWCPTSPQHCP